MLTCLPAVGNVQQLPHRQGTCQLASPQLDMFNSSLTLRPGEQCTQDVLSGQVSLFSLLTGDPTSVTVDDLTVVVNRFSASFVPVYNQTSNKPSEAAPLGAWLWHRLCISEGALLLGSCNMRCQARKQPEQSGAAARHA